jgi:hypothetical protein
MKLNAYISAYKRLGLWDEWREKLYELNEINQLYSSDIEQASSYK